jgi:hypothetical protein
VQVEEFVDVAEADGLTIHPRAWNPPQLQLRPGDDACQAQAPDGGAEPLGVFLRRANQPLAIRTQQLEAMNMSAESAGAMMILAVNIVRNGAPDSHMTRAWHHRQKPTGWHGKAHDFRQQHPGFARQDTCFLVEVNEAIERTREQQGAPDIQTTVAVAASVAEGKHTLLR